jgi:hypothetical protein
MVKLQSNQIALVTLIFRYFLGNSVIKTSGNCFENRRSLRIIEFRDWAFIIAESLLSATYLLVSEIRQLVIKNQHTSLSPNFLLDPLIQMTPNPGD